MMRTKKRYNLGGFIENNQQPIGAGLGMAGTLVGAIDGMDGKKSIGGSAASGALSGAAAGAALGPLGMAGGALIGGITSAIGAKKEKEAQQKLEREQERQRVNQVKENSIGVIANYPTTGVEMNYYEDGGKVPSWLTSALAEKDEVIQTDTAPLTDQNGDVDSLASDMYSFDGDNHEAPSGGIGFSSTSEGRIFSDELNSHTGKSFAAEAKSLGKRKEVFETKLKQDKSVAGQNTAKRMLEKIELSLNSLFMEQENLKQNEIA
jgi:hypothetical protein